MERPPIVDKGLDVARAVGRGTFRALSISGLAHVGLHPDYPPVAETPPTDEQQVIDRYMGHFEE